MKRMKRKNKELRAFKGDGGRLLPKKQFFGGGGRLNSTTVRKRINRVSGDGRHLRREGKLGKKGTC